MTLTKHSPAALEMAKKIYVQYFGHAPGKEPIETWASIIDAGNALLVNQTRALYDRLTNETPLTQQIMRDLLTKYEVPNDY
jgi:hypothetical protein